MTSLVLTTPTVLPCRITVMVLEISSTSGSLWAMKMTVRPCCDQRADGDEELDDLLRREHRGGLVEDQDAGVAVERLEDFDALLLADRQRTDARHGIDVEPEFLGRALRTAAMAFLRSNRMPERGSDPSATFS